MRRLISWPLRVLDAWLNGITMYRLVLYGMMLLALVGVAFAFLGTLPFSPGSIVLSLAVLGPVCYVTNRVLASVWKASYAPESTAITGLILFLILPPASSPQILIGIVAAGILATASKYLIAWRQTHLFNPAAIGVLLAGLLGLVHATWWIGSAVMLPFTVIVGLLILRKLRRFGLFMAFAGAALSVMLVVGLSPDRSAGVILAQAFTSWPLVFLGTVMLTEPSTMPARKRWLLVYGGLTGVVFASQVDLGPVASTPEVALVLGNLVAFIAGRRQNLRLKLLRRTRLSPRIDEYEFQPIAAGHQKFQPGQYMSWTLAHLRMDSRGNRRSFTIASSPTEDTVRLAVKYYEPSSSFKQALRSMQPGDYLAAGQLSGDFTLPDDTGVKLLFIAGGIGVTPFRSMARYMADREQHRDVVLLHGVVAPEEAIYTDVWKAAKPYGLHPIVILDSTEVPPGWQGGVGGLSLSQIRRQVPDFADRIVFISGPNAMVAELARELRHAGVKRVVTDYFSGY